MSIKLVIFTGGSFKEKMGKFQRKKLKEREVIHRCYKGEVIRWGMVQTSVAKACEAESPAAEAGGRRLRPYCPMNEPSSFMPAANHAHLHTLAHTHAQVTKQKVHADRRKHKK